jgi:hypothetical protein
MEAKLNNNLKYILDFFLNFCFFFVQFSAHVLNFKFYYFFIFFSGKFSFIVTNYFYILPNIIQ